MRWTRGMMRVWLAVALPACAARAHAHQYWLVPSDYTPHRGDVVEIGARSGVGFGGEARPWTPERCVTFTWSAGAARSLAGEAAAGDAVWAKPVVADSGGAWAAYESDYASIELPAAEFDQYLAEEGLAGPLAARKRMAAPPAGRERYRRCCKTWLAGSDDRRAAEMLGLPLELVPLARPGAAARLRVRVLWRGRPLAGALVKTWRQALAAEGHPLAVIDRDSVGVAQALRSDARGEVALDVSSLGEWLVSAERMEPCPDRTQSRPGRPAADWESTWASLTFARR